MFETAVGDGAIQLWLQQEIPKGGRVNVDMAALAAIGGGFASLGGSTVGCGCSLISLKLLVGIVDEILLVRHAVGVNGLELNV